MAIATGEGTGAGTGETGAEARGTGVELGGLESGVVGLLQGLLNPHCPVWPHLGLSGQAAAG